MDGVDAKPPANAAKRLKLWLARCAIIVAGVIAYANSFQGVFVFDDFSAIQDNHHLRTLWPLSESMDAPPQVAVSGRPVVSFSLAVNYAIDGLNERGYHAVNLAAHILAALVLFEIIRLSVPLVRKPRANEPVTGVGVALASAMLWVVHPLNTETVTYISNRTELLMGLFYLLTLWCSMQAHFKSSVWWAIFAIVCCSVGMGCKEVMASAPLIVVLYDRIFLFDSWREMIRRRGWLYLGLASTWILLAAIIISEPRTHSVGFDLGVSPWHYLLTQAGVIVRYLRLCVWPTPLIIIYDWPVVTSISAAIVPGSIVLMMLALTFIGLLRRRWWGLLGACVFMILAPSSSVIPLVSEIVAERRMYLPLAAIVTLVVVIIAAGLRRVYQPASRRTLAVILTFAAATALAIATINRNRDYHSELAIWTDAVAKAPNSAWAHNNLSVALKANGQPQESEREVREAIRLQSDNPEAHTNLAILHQLAGRKSSAIDEYREALRHDRYQPAALTNLAQMLIDSGGTDEPEVLLQRAVAAHPSYLPSLVTLAKFQSQQGNEDAALRLFLMAQRLEPTDALIAANIGRIYAQRNDVDHAIDAFNIAAHYDPDDLISRQALGDLLLRRNQPEQALVPLNEALALDPNAVDTHRKLGRALAKLNRLDEAITHYQRVLDLDHGSSEALNNLGTIEAMRNNFEQAIDYYQQSLLIDTGYDTARVNLASAMISLAATQADAGRFDEAIRLAGRAIEHANLAHRTELAEQYQQRLEKYRAGTSK